MSIAVRRPSEGLELANSRSAQANSLLKLLQALLAKRSELVKWGVRQKRRPPSGYTQPRGGARAHDVHTARAREALAWLGLGRLRPEECSMRVPAKGSRRVLLQLVKEDASSTWRKLTAM